VFRVSVAEKLPTRDVPTLNVPLITSEGETECWAWATEDNVVFKLSDKDNEWETLVTSDNPIFRYSPMLK